MNRRDFLKFSMLASAAGSIGLPFSAFANHGGNHKLLVNVMLLGGADFRFLIAPNPAKDPDYANVYANARENLFPEIATGNNYLESWKQTAPYYLSPSDSSLSFGIHHKADWLLQQFNLGNVAIICNAVGSENRRHDQAQLVMHTGDLNTSQIDIDRNGWGGRLAEVMGLGNIVSVTNDISVFCNSSDRSNRNSKTIHAKDTRNFSLSKGDKTTDLNPGRLSAALSSYYRIKRDATINQPQNWPYRKFLQHEKALREFGDPFEQRLNNVAPSRPINIRQLYGGDSSDSSNPNFDPSKTLFSTYFGRQCASLYDAIIGEDLLQLRIASLELGSWDTHVRQRDRMEELLFDLFGVGGGLDILTKELALLSNNVIDDIVYVFTSDFGRQLKSNGSNGTDHGRGTYMILVGNSVKGGVYGELFPRSEITDSGSGIRYDKVGADIEGLTSFEHILSSACNWLAPGSGNIVFPNMQNNPKLENGVDFSGLFSG